MDRKRKILWAAAVAVVLAAAFAALQIRQHKILYHFRKVDPGKLYRSGTLTPEGLRQVREKAGIRTIINLRTERERETGGWYGEESRFAAQAGIEMVELPMEPDTPPGTAQIRRFLAVATDPARAPVLVHCAQGVVRTGMMVAVYEIAVMKKDNEQVLKELEWFGHDMGRRPQVLEFIRKFRPGPETAPEPRG